MDTADLFIDADQYRRISEAQSAASRAARKTDRIDERIDELERRTDRLSLACQALWEILKEKTEIGEAAVYKKMEEIDLRDGRLDGKISATVFSCSRCGRRISSRRLICIYCGMRNQSDHIVH